MSKKDLLRQKAKPKLSTSTNVVNLPVKTSKRSEIDRITLEVRSNLDELRDIQTWWQEKKIRVSELKESIIDKLIYVRDHRKKLLPDRNFEEYLSQDVGLSKGYFYEMLQAYDLCAEYKKPGLFKDVDHKVLVNIAREKDKEKQKELVAKAPTLSREYFKKVSPTDFSEADSAGNLPSKTVVVTVDRGALTISVTDAVILRQIEDLIKSRGISIEYA